MYLAIRLSGLEHLYCRTRFLSASHKSQYLVLSVADCVLCLRFHNFKIFGVNPRNRLNYVWCGRPQLILLGTYLRGNKNKHLFGRYHVVTP
jgi:hypothetical protein